MSLPHVLLGLLSRGPASGWDLKHRMERDPALGWDAELTQIYPALRRLLRGGFVTMKRRRSEKGPPRREYRLTPAGPHDAALARLAFLERQPRELRAARLVEYRAFVAAALKKSPAGSTAARRRWRVLLESERAWADAERALLAAAPEEPPAPR